MTRRDWRSLNGAWEFAFDDRDEGLSEGWSDGRSLRETIIVPFVYQSALSKIADKSVHEIVWYARTIVLDASETKNRLLLHFGAVDYACTVWMNGAEVGGHFGGHVPFTLDVTDFVRVGENRLTVRVHDSQRPEQPRGKQAVSGISSGIDYTCTTGIWQSVWLEPVPPSYIGQLHVYADLKTSTALFEAVAVQMAEGMALRVEVIDQDTVIAESTQPIADPRVALAIPVPSARAWSPDDPHLYGVRATLTLGDEPLDSVESYCGFRTIEIHGQEILLNGRPLYLKMALDQGYWRESLMTAPSDDALKFDIEFAKACGFNGLRKHQKIEDPRWLAHCDRLGMLVWTEMPSARAWSEAGEHALMAEWSQAINRDRSHPCIVAWVPVNESWGFPGLRTGDERQIESLEKLVARTRELDNTRPVVDNDGWEHTCDTDLCTLHDYTPTGGAIRSRYCSGGEAFGVPTSTWLPGIQAFVEGCAYEGQPVLLTEVGGFLSRPNWLPTSAWDDELFSGYDSYDTREQMVEKYRDLMLGIARIPNVVGFCYTQLVDVEQETNGLMTFDRLPKVLPDWIASIHADMDRERLGKLQSK